MFLNKKGSQGFTIIEVMIVLVIAAVILLIVFLAVPALQRNSRNTQRKNDVAQVLSGVNEWTTNNKGTYPINDLALYIALKNAKLGFYQPCVNGCSFTYGGAGSYPTSGTVTNNTTTDTFKVVMNADCETNGSGTNTGNATYKTHSLAVLYTVETGGGSQPICQSS